MSTKDARMPKPARAMPLADIVAKRDARVKLKIVGTVTGLDTNAPSCIISDLSKTAVFDKDSNECSAQAVKVPPPSLTIDLSFCIHDERFILPDRSDKVICTGYLVLKESAELSTTSGEVDDYIFQAIDVTIAEELDISKWNQAARMVSHLKWNKPPVERNASLKQ